MTALRDSRLALVLWIAALALPCTPATAQIISLSSFNPTEVGGLCGLAYDSVDDEVWVYDCSDDEIYSYAPDGTLLGSIPRPGEAANDVDLESSPEALDLGGTALPAGTLLFINGESGPAEIYALDETDGTVLATLNTAFGVSHVVGGAYNPIRNTFFLVQDRVPGSADENRIAEVDPNTGAVLNTFQIGATFDVNFGDLDVSAATGNLFVVSSAESRIAEYLPDGTLVQYHALPSGVGSLSGIGLNCAAEEAWVANTSGVVFNLGDVPCGIGCPLSFNSASIAPLAVPPGGSFTVTVNVANAGPGPRTARLALDYMRVGGGPSGVLTLGRGTAPQTSGVSASLSQRVPGSAPGGDYALDLNLIDDASGTVCDTRPFTFTVQNPRLAGGSVLVEPRASASLFTDAGAVHEYPVQVYPNPIRAEATFRFTLDAPSDVRMAIYDALGREVAVLVEGRLPAGPHEATFDPTASALSTGVYVYRLVADRQVSAGRLTVVR